MLLPAAPQLDALELLGVKPGAPEARLSFALHAAVTVCPLVRHFFGPLLHLSHLPLLLSLPGKCMIHHVPVPRDMLIQVSIMMFRSFVFIASISILSLLSLILVRTKSQDHSSQFRINPRSSPGHICSAGAVT